MKRLVLLSLALLSCRDDERTLTDQGRQVAASRIPKAPQPPAEPAPSEAEPPEKAPEPRLPPPDPDQLEITRRIHAFILESGGAPADGPYTESVALADGAAFEMIPIPGGTLTLGTPADEPGHEPDESPQLEVELAPFWIGKCEVTWDLYHPFMDDGSPRNLDGTPDRDGNPLSSEPPETGENASLTDLVSRPTPPYGPMHFEMGEGYAAGWPAVAMTRLAASRFCQWLSAATGRYYRLPTEAEWEFACRAGTTTAYHFGDSPERLGDFAWTRDNAGHTHHPVATREPNPHGIHDMLGNVAEWCVDGYLPDAYTRPADPFWHPAPGRPGVVRGGGFLDPDPAASMRSGARSTSSPSWNAGDHRRPASLWYHTGHPAIGFRIVRPLEVPDVETMHRMWNPVPPSR